MERPADGKTSPLLREKFYVPGSVLEVSLDNTDPVAYGMGKTAEVFFDNSPVFRMQPDAGTRGLKPVAWFPDASPLRSGKRPGQPPSIVQMVPVHPPATISLHASRWRWRR